MITKIFVPMNKRPRCQLATCNEAAHHTGNYLKNGTPRFRALCSKHHNIKTAKKYGLKNISEVMAANAGFNSVADHRNSTHPYRKHRKDYCENIDSRFGYKCNYKIRHSAQLEVDHKNGDPTDHRKRNLQTLCANCHIYKTHANKDYASPGRKTIKSGVFSRLLDV